MLGSTGSSETEKMRHHIPLFASSLSLSSRVRPGAIGPRRTALRAASSTTSRRDDGTIVISPDDASGHTASVILCHGLGDTAMGWAEPAQVRAGSLLAAALATRDTQ